MLVPRRAWPATNTPLAVTRAGRGNYRHNISKREQRDTGQAVGGISPGKQLQGVRSRVRPPLIRLLLRSLSSEIGRREPKNGQEWWHSGEQSGDAAELGR